MIIFTEKLTEVILLKVIQYIFFQNGVIKFVSQKTIINKTLYGVK